MKIKSLFLLVALIFCTPAFAQNLNANPSAIMQQIASGSGPLTKAEYEKFWQTVGATSRADKERMIVAMKEGFILTQEYQREIWLCVEQSWISRNVAKCEKAQQKLAVMQRIMNDDQKAVIKKMDDNSKRLIQAAAKREDFKIAENAAPLKFSIENIRAIRENLERMLKRFEQVLRIEY